MKKLLPATNPGSELQSYKFGTLSFTIFILSIFLAIPVFAQPVKAPPAKTISITVSPPRLELKALPGATLQETLKIKNESDTEQLFEINKNDFIVTNDKGTPIIVSEKVSGRWSLSQWITISKEKILIKPNQSSSVNIIVKIPNNALPGGHYAMVIYKPSTEGTLNQSGSAIQQQIGTLIYLNVIGDVTEAANLKQFKVENKFQEYGPVNLTAEIENLGDIHIKPIGNVKITNLLGKTSAEFNLEEKNIFPFTSRHYNFTMTNKWHLGKYTAKINTIIGESKIPVNGLIYFWVIPYKELSAILLAIIVLTIIIFKATKKKQPKQPQDIPQENPEIS